MVEQTNPTFLTRLVKGQRVRSDEQISTLVQLAANGWSTARSIQTAFRIQSLEKKLNELIDNHSRPALKGHSNKMLDSLLRAAQASAEYVDCFVGMAKSTSERSSASKSFEAFLKLNPKVKKDRFLLGGDKAMVTVFVLVGSKDLGIKPAIEPKELEALVQIGGIRTPKTEFLGDPEPLRVRRQNWKAMIKDITVNKLPHLSKLHVK